MSRVRIVCKAPSRPEPDPRSPIRINGVVPSMTDTEVFAVADDGTEVPLDNVQAITFRVACDGEAATATLEVVDVEIDAEARVETPLDRLRALRLLDSDTGQRGVGRTHCMLQAAVLAARHFDEGVLVIGVDEPHCRELREKALALLEDRDAISRFAFATLDDERTSLRGRRFGARFVDHAVVSNALAEALG